MKILAWDLELTPLETYTWSLWPTSIPITMLKESQHILCFGARWLGDPKGKMIFKSVHSHGKEEMLETLHELLEEADATLSWNGASFDTKHAKREFVESGMRPPSPWREIDLMRAVKNQFKAPSNKLDYWARNLGVGEKTAHSGFQLWLDCMAGDEKAWKLMEKYQRQDVNLLIELYEKLLPWIPNHPSVPLYDGIEGGCVNCGSTNLQRRGYSTTGVSKQQRYQCQDCGKWNKSKGSVASSEMRQA